MEIKIDEQQVQEAMNKQATLGIKNAFEGYGVRSTIETAIAESVIPAIITEAITQAAATIDTAKLQNILAQEIARSVTSGVQHIIRETMINIILDIKKVPSYDDKKRSEERAKLEAKF